MPAWNEVLDKQLEVHGWLTGSRGLAFGEGYFQSAYESRLRPDPLPDGTPSPLNVTGEGDPSWASLEEAKSAGRRWAMSIGTAAFNAEPIFIEPDMMTVCEAAVSHFDPEPLRETDLITMSGFMLLPRSMWLVDPSGNRLSWSLALWLPTANGIHLTLFHDVQDPDDMDEEGSAFERFLKETGHRWTSQYLPTHVVNWPFGEMHPGEAAIDLDVHLASDPASPLIETPEGPIRSILRPSARGQSAQRQLQGIWRLLVQHLAMPTQRKPNRQTMKRARAARLPHEHVTVVHLRRPPQDKEPGEPGSVHWTHQWVVGGHWRNQWYPSLGIHRQIWISPYVKGPEEAPLIVNKARIFHLVR